MLSTNWSAETAPVSAWAAGCANPATTWAAGCASPSTAWTAEDVALASPANLAVTVVSGSELDLTWNNVAAATTFELQRGGVTIVTLGVGVTSYQDTGLASGTTYNYAIRAHNAASGYSAWSDVVYGTTSSVAPPPGPSPILWLDAQQLALTDGAAVTTWTDESGNHYDFTLPAGGPPWTAPTYKAADLNSKPCVEFDGVANLLDRDASQFTALPATLVIVCFWPAGNTTPDRGAFGNQVANTNGYGYGVRGSGFNTEGISLNGGHPGLVFGPPSATPHQSGGVVRAVAVGGYGVDLWLNGALNSQVGTVIVTPTATRMVLGALIGGQSTAAGALVGNVRIGELLWYNQELTGAQLTTLYTSYLKARWGLP